MSLRRLRCVNDSVFRKRDPVRLRLSGKFGRGRPASSSILDKTERASALRAVGFDSGDFGQVQKGWSFRGSVNNAASVSESRRCRTSVDASPTPALPSPAAARHPGGFLSAPSLPSIHRRMRFYRLVVRRLSGGCGESVDILEPSADSLQQGCGPRAAA